MAIISHQKETKARSEHKCNWCELAIEKGEIYLKSTHKYESTIYTWKSHVNCSSLVTKLDMYDRDGDGITAEIFQEYIDEKYHELHPDVEKNIFPNKLKIVETHFEL